ncbi:hypothetical protein TD95_004928 [Thielaviopsis punctulata]|uniref:Protein arginine methyltransferase NDUFAF7 n=1 Tax=Thielaviopsis punctulata TaxID=72032 RepID=A0A0F4ZB61_9PEZI|nr:hypothetical protein TD95_004928 [Thielaviopsis punctulata]
MVDAVGKAVGSSHSLLICPILTLQVTGPVPVASYMRMCLTADVGGYYTGALPSSRDPFGRSGDFVTSPEISQVFGEMVGLWLVSECFSQPKTDEIYVMEVGPGRGTLMDDVLRTMKKWPLISQVSHVYMVEASPELRQTQKNLLCGPDTPLIHDKAAGTWSAPWKHSAHVTIVWSETLQSVPKISTAMPLIIAHEFFDALPIHIFESVAVANEPGQHWRELMVSPTPPDSTHDSLRTPRAERAGAVPDFQLHRATAPTQFSRHLPEMSGRYKSIKQIPNAVIEVCPEADRYAADFAERIGGGRKFVKGVPSGAALIIDYGPADSVPVNSLRGIKGHQRVSPFSEAGLVDVSADVDFEAVADAALESSAGVEVHGPVQQGDFLSMMGMRERSERVAAKVDTKTGDLIEAASRRLMDKGPTGMGKVYKVMAILPWNHGQRIPVGFGGDVQV